MFEGFGRFWEKILIYVEIEAREQYSLIDTIFNYIFDFGPPGKYLYLSPKNSVGRLSRPRDHPFLYFSIDISLEVQNQK